MTENEFFLLIPNEIVWCVESNKVKKYQIKTIKDYSSSSANSDGTIVVYKSREVCCNEIRENGGIGRETGFSTMCNSYKELFSSEAELAQYLFSGLKITEK